MYDTKVKEREFLDDLYQRREELKLRYVEDYWKLLKEGGFKYSLESCRKYLNKLKSGGNGHTDKELMAFMEKIRPVAEGGRNANYARLYAQLKGFLDKDKEESENQFTASDYITIAQRVAEGLRNSYKSGGCCPVCLRPAEVRPELCVDSGREAEDKVATVGVPT